MKGKVPMRYDADSDRWNVLIDDKDFGMHCGEGFDLYVGDEPIPCRLEMDRDWYIIMKDVRFNLRKSDKYMVSV